MDLPIFSRPFCIQKLSEEDVKQLACSPNEPHHHAFEELIIGIEGAIKHFIDFSTTHFEAPFVLFIAKGKFHHAIPQLKNGKNSTWVLRFKSEFITETTFPLHYYYHDQANIKLQNGECFHQMVTLCEMMLYESQQAIPNYDVIHHLLSALFTKIESEIKKTGAGTSCFKKPQHATFRNFLGLLEENFRKKTGVDWYAAKLFMSARNLNLICHSSIHKSVSEMIETRKLLEAKKLLVNSDRPVCEIGFELGYEEKSYFTSVFKKKTGRTPTEFRDEMRKLVS